MTEKSPTAIPSITRSSPNVAERDLPAVRFAEAARRLGRAAHALGLEVPAFRCPPKVPGAARTLRRYPGGTVVAVRLRGRPFEEALSDMVAGVLVANRVAEADAARLRPVLAEAVAGVGVAEGIGPVEALGPAGRDEAPEAGPVVPTLAVVPAAA